MLGPYLLPAKQLIATRLEQAENRVVHGRFYFGTDPNPRESEAHFQEEAAVPGHPPAPVPTSTRTTARSTSSAYEDLLRFEGSVAILDEEGRASGLIASTPMRTGMSRPQPAAGLLHPPCGRQRHHPPLHRRQHRLLHVRQYEALPGQGAERHQRQLHLPLHQADRCLRSTASNWSSCSPPTASNSWLRKHPDRGAHRGHPRRRLHRRAPRHPVDAGQARTGQGVCEVQRTLPSSATCARTTMWS